MIEHGSALRGHTEPSKYSLDAARRPSPRNHPSRLSILLALAACFTPVRCQLGGPIRIIVSDELTECVPTNITWTGGTPPYTLGIGVPTLDKGPTEEFSNITRTFFVWNTDVAAENSVMIAVADNVTITRSGFLDINAGLTQSCIPEPIDPSTTTSGGTNTQGAQASSGSSSAGQPLSTSIASTTVTVSVTDSTGGTTAATPGTSSTSSSSSHSTLSPDVIGIIVAVAVALLIVVTWVIYKRPPWAKRAPAVDSTFSTPPAPPGPVAPYPTAGPPTSPTIRATSIVSPSPNNPPLSSPPMSALQFAPYGYSPPPPYGYSPSPPPPPALFTPPHPAWQGNGVGAAAVHATQTQTQMYFLGDPSLASRAPSIMSRETAGWNAQEAYAYMPQGQLRQGHEPLAIELEQGRRADAGPGALPVGAATVASTEGGSDWRDNALLARPQGREL